MPRILYGAEPAKKIKDWIIEKVPNKRAMLAIVKVGNNPASEIYVRNKVKDCEECGFGATVYHLPESVTPLVFTEVIIDYFFNKRKKYDYCRIQCFLCTRIIFKTDK